LFGKPEGERYLEKPRRCWEGNIEMEIGRGDVDWSDLALDREKWRAVVNAMIKPLGSIKFGGFLDQSRSSMLFRKEPAPCS
jgi:hypothetical protein